MFEGYGGAGDDTVSVQNISVSDGVFGGYGYNGDDSISVENATVTGGDFYVYGDDGSASMTGADNISVENVYVTSNGTFEVSGDAGADTISISNVTGNGKFNVWGGNDDAADTDSDIFNIANSTGISIISGETDSDTFAFNVASGVAVSISGLDISDKISLVGGFEKGSLHSDGLIVFNDKVSIVANDLTAASDVAKNNLYNVSVYGGGNSPSLLGELVDPLKWESVTGGFTYGRTHTDTNLISISGGLNADTATLLASTTNKTLTFNVDWLAQNASVSVATAEGYSVALSTESKVVDATWKFDSDKATYFDSATATYSITGGEVSVISAEYNPATLIELGGLKEGANSETVSLTSAKEVSLGSGAIGTSQISVNGAGYTFNFATDASILLTSNNTNINGSAGADTIAAKDLTISSDTNINGKGGNDSISVQNVSITGGASYINGDAGNDTISVQNVSVNGGAVNIYGDEGNDYISVQNATVSGGNFYVHGDNTASNAGDDSISVENVSVSDSINFEVFGDGGNDSISVKNATVSGYLIVQGGNTGGGDSDTISVQNVSVNGGAVNIKGYGGNDSISVQNATVSGGSFNVEGGDTGNDSISLQNVSVTNNSSLQVNGNAGNDSISVQNVSITDGQFVIEGDNGNDSISISNVTGKDKFFVLGGALGNEYEFLGDTLLDVQTKYYDTETDIFNVANSTGIGIASGENDSDTFAFNVASAVAVSIIGFDATDKITLSESVSSVTFNDDKDLLIFGNNLSIKVNEIANAEGFASLYSVAVTNGTGANSETTLGDLYDKATWSDTSANSFTYGRQYGTEKNLISISGGLKNVTTESLTAHTSGKTLTVQGEWLDGWDKQISVKTAEGYSVTLAANASVTAPAVWSGQGSSIATYKDAGSVSLAMTTEGTATIIAASDTRTNQLVLDGLNNDWNFNDTDYVQKQIFLNQDGKNIDSTTQVTVSGVGGYLLKLYKAANVLFTSNDTGFMGSMENDTITAKDLTIKENRDNIVGAQGNDYISLQNVSVGGTASASLYVDGGIGNDTIFISGVTGNGVAFVYGGFYSDQSTETTTEDVSSDIFIVESSTGIGISSGNNDSDTFAFNLANAVEVSIEGLDISDKISLSSAIDSIGYDTTNKALKFGDNLSIKVKNITAENGFTGLYSVAVTNGETETTLGDLYDKATWSDTSTNSFNYSRKYGETSLISLSGGLNADTATLLANTSGTSLTFAVDWLSGFDKEVSVATANGYSVALSTESKVVDATWKFDNNANTANYLDSATATYSITDGEVSVISAKYNPDTLIALGGLATGANSETVSITSAKVVSLGSGAINSSKQISVNGAGYTFNFATDASILVTSSNTNINGSEGADTIAAKDLNFTTKVDTNINGNGGNDSIFAQNISVSSSKNFEIYGGADADTISLQNVSVSDGHFYVYGEVGGDSETGGDSIYVQNVSVSGGSFNVYGNAGADSISVQNVSVEGGGYFNVNGGDDADIISVQNVSVSGYFYIYGNEDADTISVTNATVSGDGFYVDGGAGSDNISVSGVTGNNKFNVYGDGGEGTDGDADIFNIANSTGIQIYSGETDSDTFSFDVASGVAVAISGLNVGDKISLSSAIDSIGYNKTNKILTLGKVSISNDNFTEQASDITKFYNVTVYNGATETNIGDLFDAVKWSSVAADTFTYGRKYTDTGLISISGGLKDTVTADVLKDKTSGTTLTVQDEWLSAWDKQISVTAAQNYSVALENGASVTAAAGWLKQSDSVAAYRLESSVSLAMTFTSGAPASIIAASDTRTNAILLDGLKNGWNLGSIGADKTVALDSGDIGTTQISVSGAGYNFSLGAAANVLVTSNNTGIKGSSQADTITAKDFSITTETKINGNGGNDSISVQNAKVSSGNFYVNGGDDADTISASGVTVGGGNFYVKGDKSADTISVTNAKVSGGIFCVFGNEGADTISVTNAKVSGGTFQIDGQADKDNISVQNVSVSGGNFYVQGGAGADNISVSGVTGNGKFKVYGNGAGTEDNDADIFNIANSTGISIISGETDSDTFAFDVTNSISAGISGLNVGDSLSFSAAVTGEIVDSDTIKFTAAGNKTVTLDISGVASLSSIYNLAVSNGGTETNLGDLIDPIKWSDTTSNSFTYGRKYGTETNLISISGGLNSSVTTETLKGKTSGTTLTVQDEWIYWNSEVSVTTAQGYSVELEDNATVTAATGWLGQNTSVAAYRLESTVSLAMTAGDDATIIAASDTRTNAILLDGLKNGWNLGSIGADKTVALDSGDIGTTQISVSGAGYTFNFETDASILLASSGTTISGSEGADTIAAKDLTVEDTSDNVLIYGNGGNDSISVTNATVTRAGKRFDVYGNDGNDTISVESINNGGYFYVYGDNQTSGNGADKISVQNATVSSYGYFNVSGDAGNDTISVESISNSGYFNVYGDAGNDNISVQNVTQRDGSFNVYGRDDADTISVQNVTQSGGNFNVYGEDGADNISLENVSVTNNGKVTVEGGDGEDTISIRDVTGNGKFIVYGYSYLTPNTGDRENDIFNIANSTGISIKSGDNDADTFAFNVASGVAVSISGLNVGDKISLSESVSSVTFNDTNDLLIFGENLSVKVNDIADAKDFINLYSVAVTNGKGANSETTLGDMIDPYKWIISGTTAEYRRDVSSDDKLFEITGLASGLTSDSLTAAATIDKASSTVTISKANILYTTTASISGNYSLASSTALSNNSLPAFWNVLATTSETTTAKFFTANTAITYSISDDKKSITLDGDAAAQLQGVKKNSTFSVPSGNAITVADTAINSTVQITVSGADYNFSLGSAADVLVTSNNTGINGSSQADTITAKDLTITTETNIYGNAGDDTISVDGVKLSNNGKMRVYGDNGSDDSGADSISVQNATVSGGNISVIGGYGKDTISVQNATVSGGKFNVYGEAGDNSISVQNVSVASGGEFYVNGGDDADIISVQNVTQSGVRFNVDGGAGADSISVENATVTSGYFNVISGLGKDTISVQNATVSGGNFYVSGDGGADNISVSGVKGNGKFEVWGSSNDAADTETDIFNIANSTGIQIYSGENDSDTFAFDVASNITASISGLNVGDSLSFSAAVTGEIVDSDTIKFTAGDNKTVTLDISGVESLSSIYNLAVSNGGTETNLGDLIDPIKWSDTTSNSFTYGRKYGTETNLISISGGLNSSVTTETLKGKTSGTTLTVQDEWIYWNSEVSVTTAQGYSVELEDNATVTAATGWLGQNTSVAAYRLESTVSLAMTAGDDATIIAASDTRTNAILLDGLKDGWSLDSIGDNKTVALDENDINSSTQLTVSGAGYKFTFDAAADVLVTSTGTSIIGSSQADTISAKGLTVADAKGKVSISGNGGADKFNLTDVTGGGNFEVLGGGAADTFNISTSTGISVSGGEGENIFNVTSGTNISMLGGENADTFTITSSTGITLAGGKGNDTVNIVGGSKNISASGGEGTNIFSVAGGENITLDGNAGEDIFNIANSTGISIISGSTDSDTFAFNVASAVAVSISGLDISDKISLSESVSSVTFNNGTLKFGENLSIKVNDIADAKDFTTLYNVAVTNGGTETNLGDLIDPIKWSDTTSNSFTYGRNYTDTNLISIGGGLKDTVTTETLTSKTSGTTLTVQDEWLSAWNSQISVTTAQGYSVALEDNATVKAATGWVGQNTSVAAYRFESTVSLAMTAGDDATIIAASDTRTNAILLDGLKDGWSLDSIGDNKTVALDENDINSSTQLTVSGAGYKFTFDAAADVLVASSGTSIGGSSKADTISAEGLTVAGASGVFNIESGKGTDSISASQISINSGYSIIFSGDGEDTISASQISVNNDYFYINGNGGADSISVTNATVSGNGNFEIDGQLENDNISVSQISVSGGKFSINGGVGTDTISVENATVSGGFFNVDGYNGADNISVSGVSVGDGKVSINGGAGADTISVKGVTGNGKFYVYGGTASEDTDNDTFNIDSSTDISIISGDDDADTFAFNVSNAATVAIKGFTNKDIISLSGAVTAETGTGVLKLTSRATKEKTTITFDGTDIDAISDTKVIKGNGNQTTLIKLLQPNVWTIQDAATAVYGNEDDETFITVSNLKLNGASGTEISETLLDIVEDSTGKYIKISEEILGEINGTVTAAFTNQTTDDYSNYKLSLMNSETASASDTAHWNLNETNSDVTYVSAYKTTGYVVDSEQNQITYVNTAAAFDSDTFTISGLKGTITKVESGEGYNFINLTGSTVTITSDTVLGTLNNDSVKLTGENYTLQLGGDVTTVNAVPTAWGLIAGEIDSIKSAEYYKDGTTAGYVLGDKAIRFDDADSGTLQFTINGLNSNTTLTSGAITAVTVTDSEVKITSADILTTNDVTIETATGIYSLAIANDLVTLEPVETPAQWVFGKKDENTSTETVIYNAFSATAGWTFVPATSEKSAYIDYTEEIPVQGQATIAGLTTVYNETTLQNLDAPDGTFITLDSDILKGTSTVSLTSNIYHIALDQNAVVQYYDEEWATASNKITYTSARNDAGYAITARGEGENTDVVNFVAAARSDATITGLADNFKRSDISFGSDTFTLSQNILTNSNVKLSTTAAYKLALGEDVAAPSTREKYWIASDTTIANYYAGTGTISGYTLTDSQTVTYTAEKEAELTIQIDGLKGIAAHNNQIGGITLDSSTSTVTVAKVIIGANGASVKAGAGYNYELGGKGNLISNVAGGVTLTGSTSNDSLTNKGGASVLDGGKGNDVIVAGAKGDTISAGVGNDSITLGNGKDSVYYSGGNDVIIGYNTGDTVTLDESKSVREASFDGTDLIVKLNSGKLTFKDAKDKEIAVGENIYKNNLIYNADKTELTLNKKFTDSVIASGDFVSTVEKVDASNISQNFSVTANNIDSTIYGGKGNDTLTGGTGADYIEGGKGNDVLNGSAGDDTLIGYSGADTFVYSGGHDVITDYGTGNDIISISGASVIADSSVDKNGNVILTFDSDNTLTLNNANGKTVSIKSGDEVIAQIYGDNQIFNKKKTAVTVGADYSETEFDGSAYTALSTIDGSSANGNIFFTGNAKANKIYGGSGNDTLWGGAGNDTLTGNAGSDTFIYSAGKDVVKDFELGVDKISITGGVEAITNATFSGDASDTLILTINKQTLKITDKDGASLVGKEISINGAAYKFDKNQISTADGKSVTMYSAFKGAYEAASDMVSIDGSTANGAMNIAGNDKANVIYGGKKADTMNGGAGADTLNGGAGNDSIYGGGGDDTLTGDAGKDIFVFGENEGNDYIADYTAGEDKIKLINNAEISNISYSGENVIFEIGTGRVTVEKAKGSAITVIDSSGKTTTKIYTDEESAAARALDLIYDNNFMTDDAALDDITEAKYSVTQIETDSKDELSKAQDLLTFSDKK